MKNKRKKLKITDTAKSLREMLQEQRRLNKKKKEKEKMDKTASHRVDKPNKQ